MSVLLATSSFLDATAASGFAVVHTTSGNIGPYCAEGFELTYKNANNTTPFDAKFALDTGIAEGWCSFYMTYNDTGTNNWDHDLWAIWSATGNKLLSLRKEINSATFKIYWSNSTGTIQNTAVSGPSSGRHRWDIYWKIAADGTGQWTVYQDGVSYFSQSGQNNGRGTTMLDLRFVREGGTSGLLRVYSGIIIADEDTRNLNCVYQLPNGNGSLTAWTNSYTAIDEAGLDTTDFIYATADGQQETFTFPAIPAGVSADDPVFCRLRVSGIAASMGIEALCKSGGTLYNLGSVFAAGTSGIGKKVDITNDPNTAAPWTVSNLDAAEFGFEAAA